MSANKKGFADLYDLQERKRAEREQRAPGHVPAPTAQQPPTSQEAPIIQPAPVIQAAPLPDRGQPLPETPAVQWTAPSQQTGTGYTKFPHYVADDVLKTLDVYSQAILIQLLRLSWGFQKEYCLVGLPTLSKRAGISQSQARRATRKLADRGILRIGEQDFTNPNQHERGTHYHVLLQSAPTQQKGTTRGTAPIKQTPNKELKDSKEKEKGSAPPNFQNCPDCHGTGFHYVDELDRGKGVEKCAHKGLNVR